MLTFAIGDIHGCLGPLVDLLGSIGTRAGDAPHRIVCLGDYIDRGPASAAVIALLKVWSAVWTDSVAVFRVVPVIVPVGASLRMAEIDCDEAFCS